MDLKIKKYSSLFSSYPDRLVNGIKTGIAVLIGILLIQVLELQQAQWIVISTLVVMTTQLSVGGLVRKAWARFLGTLMGVVVAILVIGFFGHNSALDAFIIFFSTIAFTYVASADGPYREAGSLGIITLAIILLSHPNPTYEFALIRFVEINVGLLIALAINKLVLPIHAYKKLMQVSSETLFKFSEYYQYIYRPPSFSKSELEPSYEEQLSEKLQAERLLAKEAVTESFYKVFSREKFKELMQCQRRIFRLLTLLEYFIHEDVSEKKFFSSEEIYPVHEIIDQSFVSLSYQLRLNNKDFKESSENIIRAETVLENLIQNEPSMNHESHYVIFVMQQILRQIENIQTLLGAN